MNRVCIQCTARAMFARPAWLDMSGMSVQWWVADAHVFRKDSPVPARLAVAG